MDAQDLNYNRIEFASGLDRQQRAGERAIVTPSLQIQSVLYNNQPDDVLRAMQSTARAAELAIQSGRFEKITLRIGDSSSAPCLSNDFLSSAQRNVAGQVAIDYVFFNGNLGSSQGHNTLAAQLDADFLLILNPDVVMAPRTLENLVAPFALGDVGMVEAKQLPIEHPKDYDPVLGDTLWASTACAMIPVPLFKALEGFDTKSFFLYCDDVDFSWRVRLAGQRVVFNPSAVVFHDKRLSEDAQWQSNSSEQYYSAEAAMLLAHKWSRADLAEEIYQLASHSENELQKKAAAEFARRKSAGLLVPQLDPDHKIGYFSNHRYARHRYVL